MDFVAVIDIGKTNKKLCIFDEKLQLRHEVAASFPAQSGKYGLLYEDSNAIWSWYRQQLKSLYQQYPYKAIAVTTHGATYALLDAAWGIKSPIVAYESPLDDQQQQQLDADFYGQVESIDELQNETGTCDLPLLINPAKSLFYQQQLDPSIRERTASQFIVVSAILGLSPYWGSGQ